MNSKTNISPNENALDSLKRLAENLQNENQDSSFFIKEILVWGWHTVSMLTYSRLLPERNSFDPWMQDYLQVGKPDFDVEEDAYWDDRRQLRLLEILDILSELELPILKQEFYQGWQDKTVRCHELRAHIEKIIGNSINFDHRKRLLFLLAVHNRLFHLPSEVSIDVKRVFEVFPNLLDLIENLLDSNSSESEEMKKILATCRTYLEKN